MKIVVDDNEFAALRRGWQELESSSGARPFQRFDWAYAWYQSIGRSTGRSLSIATLWDRERLTAVWPLVVHRYKGLRLLEWIGARATDYCDAIVAPDVDAQTALGALWKVVRRQPFDIARFGQVRTDAKIYPFLQGRDPWTETKEEAVGIPITWRAGKEWLDAQPGRKEIRYRLRRLNKLGFEFHIWQPSEPLEPLIEAVLAQKRAWLSERGLGGFIGTEAGAQFLLATARAFAEQGILHLSVMRSKNEIAAMHFGFLSDNVLYYYIPTYDASLAKYGAGTALFESLLMWACDNDVRRMDLLIGAYGYKARYGVTAEHLQTLVIPNTLRGRAGLALYRIAALKKQLGAEQPAALDTAVAAPSEIS